MIFRVEKIREHLVMRKDDDATNYISPLVSEIAGLMVTPFLIVIPPAPGNTVSIT